MNESIGFSADARPSSVSLTTDTSSAKDAPVTKNVSTASASPWTGWFTAIPNQMRLSLLILIAGILAIVAPTMVFVARETWSTEQGAHGPIVLLTGLWLIARTWKAALPIEPPPLWRPLFLFVPLLMMFMVARVSQIIEVEGFLMYAALLAGLYGLVGGHFMRRMMFPLAYMAFIFPPPETLIYAVTLPMKIAITEGAVGLLSLLNYPIGHTGVWIQIGQYQLLMAAACSGLNSIVSLSVLSTFYIYVRYSARGLRSLLLLLLIVPVAVAANFVRVLILILLTYHFGEAVAQGFAHNFAGLTMFAAALMILFGADTIIGRFLPNTDRQSGPASLLPRHEVKTDAR